MRSAVPRTLHDAVRQVIDVNLVALQSREVLSQAIGGGIHLKMEATTAPCLVLAERAELEQLLVALAVSARYGIPDGGTLKMGVSSVIEVPPGLRHPHIRGRSYARVTVTCAARGPEQDLAGIAQAVRLLDGVLHIESDESTMHLIVDLPCVERTAGF